MKPLTLIFSISILFFTQCSFEKNTDYLNKVKHPELFLSAMQNLTDIVVYDIFSPPVASRVYLYPTLAAYEIMAQAYPDQYATLVGQVKDLQTIPVPDNDDVNPHLSALFAFNTVGKTLIFSENKMETFEENFLNQLDEYDVPRRAIKASKEHGNSVAKTILEWASKDMYNQTRTFPKYTIREEDQFWKPTPPDYMDGIEPHWKEIRTMVLDSSNQFEPKPPLPFDLTDGSPFQKQLMEVFEIGNKLNEEQVEIAKFWDCNPYVSTHKGHVMFALKKISPGAHWIGITKIVSRNRQADVHTTVAAYAKVSIAIADAFISCWDEKYRSNLIRPETLINKVLDENWYPLLQTPPFPEYTSGHSVVSGAASVILTDFFGDNIAFDDDTELPYDLPIRSYRSFNHAAEEAAVSRLYGGIHYRKAIDEGLKQGRNVGNYISQKLGLKN